MESLFLKIMSIYRQYFKEKKVWLIRKSRLLVANLISLLESYYSTNYYWILEIFFALVLGASFQKFYLQTENTALLVYQMLMNTTFWFVFLRMISKYLRGKRVTRELLKILSVVGFYLLLWIPIGLDLTDEGWRLEAAYTLMNFPELYSNKATVVGSDLLLGIWQKIGPHQLLWSRLGFGLVILLITAYTYRLLRLFYTTNALGMLLVISMLYFLTNVRLVPDYNNLGILFLLAGAYHLTYSERVKNFKLHAALSGTFLSIAILCNFSLVVFLLIFPAYNLFFRKKLAVGPFGLSFLLSGLLLWSLMMLIGVHGVYVAEIKALLGSFMGESSIEESIEVSYHSSEFLLNRYLKDAKTLGILTLIDMGILFAGTLLLAKIHRAWRIFVFLFCYIAIWNISDGYSFEFVISSLLLALLLLSTFIQNVEQKNFRAWFWAISFFALTFLGSNNGVYAITFTGGTILLTPIILITLKSRIVHWMNGSFSLRFHTIGAFFFILIFSYWSKPAMIYRDAPAREIHSMMGVAGMFGIHSTEVRSAASDAILSTLNEQLKADERVLFVNNIASLEFISDRSFPMYWHVTSQTKKEKTKLLLSANGPEYILINHKDPRDARWPLSAKSYHKIDKESYDFYMRLCNSGNFESVFGNEVFSLYRKLAQ